ncbi:AlkZ-related protein [Sutcliffiella rhizosphaerae]|uniref:Uncharacterized protein n=1 Tax=Sutcliffiella rhizosphaerae TaxID=2880967 RepID=A0ABM8YQ08_9BACI|nr:hypothetical protein [Sutcliffiella rhizosphaerae]CAG9622088.1 hypothetical protein BACCIP111883_02879 [Sutcliffiella rhizosphaerae]
MTLKTQTIHTYTEAVEIINKVGILPLAPLFDDFPSLGGLTKKEAWHSDTEEDPWKWRTKFAAEGHAAYGKFLKKKAVFISKDMLPLMLAAKSFSHESVQERYKKGEVSREALTLYSIIEQQEGIDTRLLRVEAGMKEKEKKKPFDQALLELQGNLNIVVSGTKEKQDDNGEKNGWSSTSYETMKHWCEKNAIPKIRLTREEAREKLLSHLSVYTTDQTMKKIKKVI